MSIEALTLLSILTPIITALISGIVSYFLSIRKFNKDIEALKQQHYLDLEKLKENHKLEMEKLALQQEHEKQMKTKDGENQIGNVLITKLMGTFLEDSNLKNLLSTAIKDSIDKNKGDKK